MKVYIVVVKSPGVEKQVQYVFSVKEEAYKYIEPLNSRDDGWIYSIIERLVK